jgi:di/tricarboxylate transporter
MFKALAISLWLIMNPVHLTMTSIDYVPGTDSLKVYFRMYYDDFLRDYQTIDDDRNLKTLFGEQSLPTDIINRYFNSKVFIYVNNKLLIGKLLTVNHTGDEINLNLIYRSDKKPRKITVRNLILTGWYSDQTNLTILKIGNFEKGIKLTSEYKEETISIK